MPVTSSQSGAQACTIGTEHTLGTAITAAGVYVLKVDLTALGIADQIEVRVRSKCRGADPAALAFLQTFPGGSTDPLKVSIPVAIAAGETFECSVRQTAGTGRTVPWNILSL